MFAYLTVEVNPFEVLVVAPEILIGQGNLPNRFVIIGNPCRICDLDDLPLVEHLVLVSALFCGNAISWLRLMNNPEKLNIVKNIPFKERCE